MTSRLVSTGTSFIRCIRISFSKIESGCFLSSRSCCHQGQKAKPQTCIYLQDPALTQRPNNTNTTVPHSIRSIPLVIKTPVRDWTERKMRTTEGRSLANTHRSGSWRYSNQSMCIVPLIWLRLSQRAWLFDWKNVSCNKATLAINNVSVRSNSSKMYFVLTGWMWGGQQRFPHHSFHKVSIDFEKILEVPYQCIFLVIDAVHIIFIAISNILNIINRSITFENTVVILVNVTYKQRFMWTWIRILLNIIQQFSFNWNSILRLYVKQTVT